MAREPSQILAIVHGESSRFDVVEEILSHLGVCLVTCCPNGGDPVPDSLEPFVATIVFGGPMSVTSAKNFSGRDIELKLIERILKDDRPLLGLCLGAQLITHALGGRVYPDPEGRIEVGYCEINPTSVGKTFLSRPMRFYQWHGDVFDLPSGAELLATATNFPNQAFLYGHSTYAVQFHPEITDKMIKSWARAGEQDLAKHGAPDVDTQLYDHGRYRSAVYEWFEEFVRKFINNRTPELGRPKNCAN